MMKKTRKHIAQMSFSNNPNIGLYAFANDDVCLVGQEVDDKQIEEIKDILDVPVHRISIAGTSLIGVFCAGNSKKILVPHIIQQNEKDELKRIGLDYCIIDTRFTALGNIIAANDKGAVVSPDLDDTTIKEIEKSISVPTRRGKISELNNMGSCILANNNGAVAHSGIKEAELVFIENTLKVNVIDGTVNMGSPYVKSGIIANSNGFIIGSQSAGPEITNTDIALGFLKE